MRTQSRQTSHITFWKLVVVSVCLCVFLFSLHAKLAQYDAPSPSVISVKALKLNVESRPQWQNSLTLASLLFLILPLIHILVFRPQIRPGFALPADAVPVRRLQSWQVQRFFRPPPAL